MMATRNRIRKKASIRKSGNSQEAEAAAVDPGRAVGETGFWAGRGSGPLFHGVLPMGYGFSGDDIAAATDDGTPESSELFSLTRRPNYGISSRQNVELEPVTEAGEFQEFVAGRLGHLHRQLSELQASGARRVAEERRESRFLLLALGAALVFCFVAFYLTQAQVREVRDGVLAEVQDASERAEEKMASSFQELHSRHLPALRARLETKMQEGRDQDLKRLKSIEAELRQVGDRNAVHLGEALRILEDQLWRVRTISEEVRVLQKELLDKDRAVARPGDSSAGPASKARQYADSGDDKSP